MFIFSRIYHFYIVKTLKKFFFQLFEIFNELLLTIPTLQCESNLKQKEQSRRSFLTSTVEYSSSYTRINRVFNERNEIS